MKSTLKKVIVVDAGVPIPIIRRGAKRGGYTEAMRNMQIGDSFAIPIEGIKESSLRNMAVTAGIRISIGNDENSNRRCWRTA